MTLLLAFMSTDGENPSILHKDGKENRFERVLSDTSTFLLFSLASNQDKRFVKP